MQYREEIERNEELQHAADASLWHHPTAKSQQYADGIFFFNRNRPVYLLNHKTIHTKRNETHAASIFKLTFRFAVYNY
jgi:hypothetical protein